MLKSVWLAVGGVVGLCWMAPAANAAVVDSINETKAPKATSWNATEVGWLYTPSFAYNLTGIESRFFFADARTVTLELYDEHPLLGGSLLRSAGFAPSTSFSGGVFPTLSLVAGEDYFVGFRNVGNLGVNITADAGATSLGTLFFSFANDGSYGNGEGGETSQPLLRFLGDRQMGPSPVPEPATMALLGMGVLPLLRCRRRRQP